MTPAKLNLFFANYPYSGNGGCSSEYPAIRTWFAKTILAAKKDERIGEIEFRDFVDTPIPMTRNESVEAAKQAGADVLCMVDSDMHPDYELGRGEPGAQPFFPSSFDFLYQRKMQGKVTVVAAPYCGPPPHENVYIFRPASYQSEHPNVDIRIEQYTREEAAIRTGFEEVMALPTGLILFDLKAFDLLTHPYFYYEYEGDGAPCPHCGLAKPGPQARKASTEDVTCTRDIAMAGCHKLGYNPLFVNWDAWAAHMKPKAVGKPRLLTPDMVGHKYAEAVLSGRPRQNERLTYFRASDQLNAVKLRESEEAERKLYFRRSALSAHTAPVEILSPA